MLQRTLAIAGVVMLVTAGALVLRGRSTPAPVAVTRDLGPINALTHVQHDGPTLRLHWNPETPAVRSARAGTVIITDGSRESRMELGPEELRSGVASWWPESRDVTFRLKLDGADAGSMRASAAPKEEVERRPSAFAAPPKMRKSSAPVKHVQPVTARVEMEETPKRGSKIGRAFGKIPLLKRLRRNPD